MLTSENDARIIKIRKSDFNFISRFWNALMSKNLTKSSIPIVQLFFWKSLSLTMSCSEFSNRPVNIIDTFLSTKVIVLLIWIEVDLALLRSFQVKWTQPKKNILLQLIYENYILPCFLKIYRKIKYFRSNVWRVHSKQIDIRRLRRTFDLDSCIPATKNI